MLLPLPLILKWVTNGVNANYRTLSCLESIWVNLLLSPFIHDMMLLVLVVSMRTIHEVITALKKAYLERDSSHAQSFVNEWFSSTPVILGTSFNELFVGKDAAIELFISDWTYWYDVTIDEQPTQTIPVLAGTFIRLEADLQVTFEDSVERDQRYISMVKDISQSAWTPLQKAHHITWMLTHFLTHRSITPRSYQRQLAIELLLIEEEGELKIQLAHFFSPETNVPDILLDDEEYVSEITRYRDIELPLISCEEAIDGEFTAGKPHIQGTVHSIIEGNDDVVVGLLQESIHHTVNDQILDRLSAIDGLKNTDELYRFNQQLQWILRGQQSSNNYRLKRFVALATTSGSWVSESYPYYYILEEKDSQDHRLPIKI